MKNLTSVEFFEQLQKSKEGLQYLQLIESAKVRTLDSSVPRELHHVHPRGLGGAVREKSNLVWLTVFEHCEAHVLLANAIPCYETAVPLNRIAGKQFKSLTDLEKISLEEIYEWSKTREASRSRVGRKGRIPWNKGKKMSDEYRQKISNSHKHRNYRPLSEEERHLRGQKISEAKKGKPGRKHSEEEKLRQSQKNKEKGIKPPIRTGKINSEEHKQRISEALKGRKCPSKGTTWVSLDSLHKRIPLEKLQNYLDLGYRLGRK